MRAAVLSIGSELLEGYLTDTNATFLAQELSALGIELVGVSQVGDDLARIVRAFRRALDDADVVVATGGIGPTADDLTREAVAEICGETPVVDAALADTIRTFFTMRGIAMPEQNVKQAWVIPSSETLPNPMGTAPGWFVRHDDKAIVIMPGVPREMFRMWQEQAAPRIAARMSARAIVSRTLKTIGIGESAVEQEIINTVTRGYPVVATYAKDDGVHIRITAMDASRDAAEAAVRGAEGEIRAVIGRFVYGYLDTSLANAVVAPLTSSDEKLAIWEAGNAGRLAGLLQESPIADRIVVEARSTSVSAAVATTGEQELVVLAAACATSAAADAGVPLGASIVVEMTDGDSLDRVHGRVAIALVDRGKTVTLEHEVTAIASEVRRRATMWACDFLWTTLRDRTTVRPE